MLGGGRGGGGGGVDDRADRERALHLRRVRVALEEVRAVDERDREGLVADAVDVGRHVDARPAQMEVVEARVVVDDERVRAGVEVLHGRAARIRERDREGVALADVAGEHRIRGARGTAGAEEGDEQPP